MALLQVHMSFGGWVLRNKIGVAVLMVIVWVTIALLWFWLGYYYFT